MNPTPSTQSPVSDRVTLPRDSAAVQEAERAGFDINAIENNLNLNYDQRALKHARARAVFVEFKRHRISHL